MNLSVNIDLTPWLDVIEQLNELFEAAIPQWLLENVDEIETIVHANNNRIWSTQGANIDADWEGNDLVDTGALRDDLATVDLIVVGDELFWASDIPYAQHVDARYRIYGIDQEAMDEIGETFVNWFNEKVAEIG